MSERHHIYKDVPEPAGIFGHLVQLATPIITDYHGDLYHDAIWLTNYMTDVLETGFYYGVRRMGTHIGTDKDLIQTYNDHTYHVTFERNDENAYPWTLVITEV